MRGGAEARLPDGGSSLAGGPPGSGSPPPAGAGVLLRSAAFNLAFVLVSAAAFLAVLPFSLFSRRVILWARSRLWMSPVLGCLRAFCGVSWREEGRENVPDGPCIFASRHESAFEIFFFGARHPDVIYVMKRELYWIPFLGWYMLRTGMIPLDRSKGLRALNRLKREAHRRRGRLAGKVLIFPEGTRNAPGVRRAYLPGAAVLAGELGVPVVPVALDSGRVWGRNSFVKRPGCVTVRYLPPLDPSLAPRELLECLRAAVEGALERPPEAEGLAEAPERPEVREVRERPEVPEAEG